MSEYIKQCESRVRESIKALRASGKEPQKIELSSDVISFISMGGFWTDRSTFLGLEVIERRDLTDHIQVL